MHVFITLAIITIA